jgi:flavin-binding protein dodecin
MRTGSDYVLDDGARTGAIGPATLAGPRPASVLWLPSGRKVRSACTREDPMAKRSSSDGVYRVIDVVGTSKTSWEEAAKNAVETASKSLRDLRIAEVAKMDLRVENGKVVAYRTRVQLSFKYES